MISTLFLCFLLQSELLVKRSLEVIESQAGKDKLFYESGILRSEALEVLDYLRSMGADPVPYIYRLPNSPNHFVISTWMQVKKEEPQRRLLLLSKDSAGFREVYRSSGVGDSWILTPTFFVGRDRILILAELGAEEYYGLIAFEAIRDKVIFLGRLDVGRQVNRDGVVGFESPLNNSKVEYAHGSYYISVFGDIYIEPGLSTQRKISDRKGRVRITLDSSGFRLFPSKLPLSRTVP